VGAAKVWGPCSAEHIKHSLTRPWRQTVQRSGVEHWLKCAGSAGGNRWTTTGSQQRRG